jgi:hypothetical protein
MENDTHTFALSGASNPSSNLTLKLVLGPFSDRAHSSRVPTCRKQSATIGSLAEIVPFQSQYRGRFHNPASVAELFDAGKI